MADAALTHTPHDAFTKGVLFDRSDEFACMLPFIPRFRHELFDLTKSEPREDEKDISLRIILELMKRIRQKNQLRAFFAWLAQETVNDALPVDLLRKMLNYAWTVDTSLDAEQIARTVEHNPQLKSNVMTYFEEIIAKGKAEGEAHGEARGKVEGEIRGVWIGKIQMLERLMGLPESITESFSGVEVAELQKRFEALERSYGTRFKPKD